MGAIPAHSRLNVGRVNYGQANLEKKERPGLRSGFLRWAVGKRRTVRA